MDILHPGISLDESGCNTFHKLATGIKFNKRGKKIIAVFFKAKDKRTQELHTKQHSSQTNSGRRC